MLTPEREAILRDGGVLEGALNNDAVDALKASLADRTQQNKRVAARAVFAYVEGMAHILRQNCVAFQEAGDCAFKEAELSLLREEAYSLDEQGRVEIRPDRRGGLRRRLRFAIAMFARHFDPSYVLDCSGDGWREFSSALDIRNRVTHPKSSSDLDISDEDLLLIWGGFTWFHDQMGVIYGRSIEEFRKRLEEKRAERTALEATMPEKRSAGEEERES